MNQVQIDSKIMNAEAHIQTWTVSIDKLNQDINDIVTHYESRGWAICGSVSNLIKEKQDRIEVLEGRIEGYKETLVYYGAN